MMSLHVQQYVNFKLKTVSPNTVRKHLWNLSKCFDSAVKQNIIAFNPVKGIDMPKKIKYTGAKYYTEKQIDDLLAVIKGDIIEGVILVAIFYGMRRSDEDCKHKTKKYYEFFVNISSHRKRHNVNHCQTDAVPFFCLFDKL